MFAQDQRCQRYGSKVFAMLSHFFSVASARGNDRRLRLCETLSFGEKRFIALVECDRRMYLLAGTPENISLLRCLNDESEAVNSGGMIARDNGSDTHG